MTPLPLLAAAATLIPALGVLGPPLAHADRVARDGAASMAESWVGCWSLEHREDWSPHVDRQGFPTGSAAPAPRLLLLDRLPGRTSNLTGAPGEPTRRAEWVGTTLRGTESWALRSDGNVYLEHPGGARVISLVMEGPPDEATLPAHWFFRRTDTNLPELRAVAVARRVSCPDGRAPHRRVDDPDLAELLAAEGFEGSFVHYDGTARLVTRANPASDTGLPIGTGTARTSAWNHVAGLVDEARAEERDAPRTDRAVDAEAGTAWIAGTRLAAHGRMHGFALHLHRVPDGILEEGEDALDDLLARLLEGMPTR